MLTRIRFSGEALVWTGLGEQRFDSEAEMLEWLGELISGPLEHSGFGEKLLRWEATVKGGTSESSEAQEKDGPGQSME